MIQITDTTLKITDNFIKSHSSISCWQINCSIYSEIVYTTHTLFLLFKTYYYGLFHTIFIILFSQGDLRHMVKKCLSN